MLPVRTSKAFTLLELIVVIVILGILAVIAIPTFSRVTEKSKDSSAETTLRALDREAKALAAFESRAVVTGDYTAAAEDLNVALSPGLAAAGSFGTAPVADRDTFGLAAGSGVATGAVGVALESASGNCVLLRSDAVSTVTFTRDELGINCSGVTALLGPDAPSPVYVESLTAPGAPRTVTTAPSSTSVVISFAAPTSDGGSEITRYDVFEVVGGADGAIGATPVASGTSSPLTVSDLVPGGSYTFVVRAVNAQGAADAAPVNVSTAAVAPAAPTNVAAVAGTAGDFGKGTASVSFTAPADTGGAGISRYDVYSGTTKVGTGTVSPVTATDLAGGVSRSFTVKAVNAAGIQSPASAASESVIPVTVPSAPVFDVAFVSDSAITASLFYPVNVPVTSGGSEVTEYRMYLDGNQVVVSPTVSGLTATGLVNGTSYEVTVKAFNAAGASAATVPVTAVPVVKPVAPTGVSVTLSGTTASVYFTPVASSAASPVTEYRLYNGTSSAYLAVGSSSPFTVTGLAPNAGHSFRVAARNAAGSSPYSSTVTAIAPNSTSLPLVLPTAGSGTYLRNAGSLYQSVTLDGGQTLSSVGVQLSAAATPFTGTIEIYRGAPVAGQAAGGASSGLTSLYSASVSSPTTTAALTTFTLASPVTITTSGSYTIRLTSTSTPDYTLSGANNAHYTGGSGWYLDAAGKFVATYDWRLALS